jgi:hypothetical protein
MLSQFRQVDEGQKASFQSATITRSNAVQNIAQGFDDVYHKLWGALALVQNIWEIAGFLWKYGGTPVETLWKLCGKPSVACGKPWR